ncbi:MAG: acyl-CoA dehydrogenase family protein [Dehalococcoidales bacterium]|nr:acyl-CoA dehydrogenase family protein [Dehalococcoidales bacterium]
MNFNLSEEQEMIKTMARDFLTNKCAKAKVREIEKSEKGYSPELWKEMAGLGWQGLVLPEKYGGGGMSFLDLAVLLEEMGRGCLPGPFIPTAILGGLSILEFGTDEQKKAYLPGIAGGDSIFTMALTEADAQYSAASMMLKATADKDDYVLSGTKVFVPDAHIADYIICVARTAAQGKPDAGITLFIVDAKAAGIKCTLLKSMGGDRLCEVVFDKVKVPGANILGKLNEGWAAVQKVLEKATVAKSCEMVGELQAALDMTVAYAKDRKQFGHPIGTFQVLQHYCAQMVTDVEGARFATYEAAWKVSEGMPCRKEVAVAKAWTGDASKRVMAYAHQIHGAIGVTMDHDLQFYTRRLKAAEPTFGDADAYREVVAQEMGL